MSHTTPATNAQRMRAAPCGSAGVVGILLASLEALAAAGQVDAACRFAGQACVSLRHDDAHGERQFNALLHRLAPRVPW
ncbi:hypothetical protein [Metallibacterium scheffleri]|uniref:Uncharacterized protein n=1 Tax=Metallibacterium scheffleri TaxID=993689 RepID=A0A4S3KSH9_9GAMM|nr:hypothetical protein [Metallibacterium scheffleri]THD11448.1 hypothetical protein B1806_03415 [Metallibacterium scheffleri]